MIGEIERWFPFFVESVALGPNVRIRLWPKPRGRESTYLFFITEQQEQARVPAHKQFLLLSFEFRIKLVFDLPKPPPSNCFRTISTGNLNLLTGQKIRCEIRHPACFCKKRLTLLELGGLSGPEHPPTPQTHTPLKKGPDISVSYLFQSRTPDVFDVRPLQWD